MHLVGLYTNDLPVGYEWSGPLTRRISGSVSVSVLRLYKPILDALGRPQTSHGTLSAARCCSRLPGCPLGLSGQDTMIFELEKNTLEA